MFIRRFIAVTLVAALGMWALDIAPVRSASLPFPDLEGVWFSQVESVTALQERGIIQGYADGTFKPHAPINRAELLKIIFKGHNVTRPSRRCFSDISLHQWYAPFVCTAARRGIVDGYANNTFKPGQTVNYAEAIKIVLRAYGRDISDAGGELWYRPYVEELHRAEVLPKHSYVPWAELTRVQAADLIWRMLEHEEDKVLHSLSAGCGKAVPSTRLSSVTVNGVNRTFILTMPRNYVPHDPAPLIIAFHGRTNNNQQVQAYYKLDSEAPNYMIAYPAANSNGNGSFSWGGANGNGDIELFDAIVKRLSEAYCIDMTKIYTVGHSLGGWFANNVACHRGDIVRASASVGSSGSNGSCSGPAAAMLIHNPNDRLASFGGSEQIRAQRTETNYCSWETVPQAPQELACSKHQNCLNDNDVWWCPHTQNTDTRGTYYPHHWPRGTATHIINFFESLE